MSTALIYGVTGQDGSYLAELLLSQSYSVIGVKRRTSTNNTTNIQSILNHPNFTLIEGDITDQTSINNIITQYQPHECYNTAAQSHVATSFEQPSYTFDVTAKGVLFLLEAIKNYSPYTKLLQFSTSEMFGDNYTTDEYVNKYQDEDTPLSPNSPYAVAKTAAHHLVKVYRTAYKLHCSTAITFNHEGIRRGENFVTRKITKYIGELHRWLNDRSNCVGHEFPKLKLGNIDSVRDFGDSDDYCGAFMKILQQPKPDDYVICTGVGHSIKEFLEEAFGCIGKNWQDFVEIDPNFYRPYDVPYLCGRYDKAKRILDWEPTTDFKTLVKKMVLHDLQETNLS